MEYQDIIGLDIIAFKKQPYYDTIDGGNILLKFIADPEDDRDWDEINFDLENVRESLIDSGYDIIYLKLWSDSNSMTNIYLEMNDNSRPIICEEDVDDDDAIYFYSLSKIKKLTVNIKSKKELYPEY